MISSGAFAIVARALAGAGAGCATRTGAASTATISALLGGLKLSSQGGVAHARSGLLEIPHHRRWSSSAMRPPATAAGSPSPGGDATSLPPLTSSSSSASPGGVSGGRHSFAGSNDQSFAKFSDGRGNPDTRTSFRPSIVRGCSSLSLSLCETPSKLTPSTHTHPRAHTHATVPTRLLMYILHGEGPKSVAQLWDRIEVRNFFPSGRTRARWCARPD